MASAKSRNIIITQARQNNLKSLNLEIPIKELVVITGPSGSGKSSLAFDTLYAEGQRRYVESLSTYIRQFLEKMPKPQVEAIENIPPAIALEQRNSVLNSRSNVGTQTEILDFLKILYAKIGETQCLNCGGKVQKIHAELILDQAIQFFKGVKGYLIAPVQLSTEKIKAKKKFNIPNYLMFFREQGYRRIVLKKKGKPTVYDLEELSEKSFPKITVTDIEKQNLYLVVDRLKLSQDIDSETKNRLFDSIGQAIHIGNGKLCFYNIDANSLKKGWKEIDCRFACVDCGREHQIPEPNLFSFNSPLGACESCSGFGYTLDLDESLVVPDPNKTIKNGAIDPFSKPSFSKWQAELFRFAERNNISIGKRYRELTLKQKELLWKGSDKDKTFKGISACFDELAKKKYKLHVRVFIRRYQSQTLCKGCKGARLKPDALTVKINGLHLGEICELPINEANQWFQNLKLNPEQEKVAKTIFDEVLRRLNMLEAVGVEYLTLSRLAKTLSGGEFQRINLAAQLGHGLCGTLYVLDEPSIGLHAADTEKLIHVLKDLQSQGNTVLVVEHDLEVIRAADRLIELGPGSGRNGGELIANHPTSEVENIAGSLTGKYLSGAFQVTRSHSTRPTPQKWIKMTGCRENNLQNIDVEIPLERFVVVTGVSGSGKSTLIHKTLYQALARLFSLKTNTTSGEYDQLYGAEQIQGVVLLDQKPIGKSSRSNPATYLKAWDEVRRIYANQVLSLRRGYTPQHFSFNVDGGRCPVCKGEGEVTLDMHFMAEIKLPCEECNGKRFKKDVLEIQYRGKNVAQLLESTIDEAYDTFRDHPILLRKLGTLRDVGLGYLQLGQSATTLSGGESQRLKIASALEEKKSSRFLYIFDEPTTGLHLEDIKKLLPVLQDLVDAKHSVIVIEHHLDVIAQADWVIDIGPGGGKKGGNLIASCPPQKLVYQKKSITGQMLNKLNYEFPRVPPAERDEEILF